MIRLNDEFVPPDHGGLSQEEQEYWGRLLEKGRPAERHEALQKLVGARAETVLTSCLKSEDALTSQLATAGLWECWLNEQGPGARSRLDEGIAWMESGQLQKAEQCFEELIEEFPGWAEPVNKRATALYLMGRAEDSIACCREVVAMKPNHFGAWNGMALCAVQLQEWETAYNAAKKGLELQPNSTTNQQIAHLAMNKLGLC